jgi:hypothetical protein
MNGGKTYNVERVLRSNILESVSYLPPNAVPTLNFNTYFCQNSR